MMRRDKLHWTDNVSREHAASALAVTLTILFSCLSISCSWYMMLIKSRMVRASERSTLLFLEACSIGFAYVAHTALIHYALTRRLNPILQKIANQCVAALCTILPRSSPSASEGKRDDNEYDESAIKPLLHAGQVGSTSGEVRDRGVSAAAAAATLHMKAKQGTLQEQPSRRGRSQTSLLARRNYRDEFAMSYVTPLLLLVCMHWIVHRTVEEKHRQSQEIILALLRCSTDAIAILCFTAWCIVRVLRMSASHNPNLQRVWNYVRIGVIGFTVITITALATLAASTINSIDPVPHLRTCILDDHECDPCEAEGLQLNPMLRWSWVWPAFTPRRLFTFYTGSEKCAGRRWHPIAYLDEPSETLIVSSRCADGAKPHVYLHRPENNELHGRDDFFIVEVRAGNKQYHRDLESWYGTAEKAQAAGVTVNRDPKTKGILSVEITPSLLVAKTREPGTEAEKKTRGYWASREVFEIPLGHSVTYVVHCPALNYEEYYVFPLKSKFQLEVSTNDAKEEVEEECPNGELTPDELAKHEPAGNVLVLLFDAISRQSVRRTLPRFSAWLQDFHRRHKGNGNNGHIVVEPVAQTTLGISTAGNMAPQFAGVTNEALGRPSTNEADMMNSTVFNIAKAKFGDLLHTTMTVGYCHDFFEVIMGNREASSGHGGRLQGVDHYVYEPFCHLEYSGLQSNFQGPYSIIRRCIDNRHAHEYLFNYTEYILKRQMRQQRKITSKKRMCTTKREAGEFFFDLTYFVDGHEGTHTAITLVDQALVEFMDRLENEVRFFDNPLNTLIFAADHGNHMGHYFEFTNAGRFERTTPAMLYIIHPEVFRRVDLRKGRVPGEAMTNFITRSKRVLTPVDFYLTLGDLLGIDGTPYEGYMKAKVAPASMFDARSGPSVSQCRDFSSRKEFYLCAYHFCSAKEDAAAAVRAIGDY